MESGAFTIDFVAAEGLPPRGVRRPAAGLFRVPRAGRPAAAAMPHDMDAMFSVSGHEELQRCADKARAMKSEQARQNKKKKKIKHGKPRPKRKIKHRPSVAEEIVRTSCSSEIKPVWIAAWAFFVAGALDDAMYYSHSRKKATGWFPKRRRAFLHAVVAHAYCAAGCYYVESKADVDAATRRMLKGPLVVLCGWMWKSAVVVAAESAVDGLVATTWAACLVWFLAAGALSVAAVYYASWARRQAPRDVATEPAPAALGRIFLMLSADAAVLPIAALWDEALVYHTSSLTPDAVYRAAWKSKMFRIRASWSTVNGCGDEREIGLPEILEAERERAEQTSGFEVRRSASEPVVGFHAGTGT